MDVYVMKNGARLGPFPPFRLAEMLEDGTLTPQDQVWHDGMNTWLPLAEAPSLRAVLKEPAPPAVPAPPPEEEDEGEDTAAPPALTRAAAREMPPSVQQALHVLRERRRLAWRRFFARQIDMSLAAGLAIGGALASGLATAWDLLTGITGPVSIAAGWMLLEALLLSTAGTTPGRAMVGIRVFIGETGKLPFLTALKRSALVLAAGAGLGLPIIILLIAQWVYSFWQYQKYGATLWDKSCGTRVASRRLNGLHAAGIAVFISGLFAFAVWLNYFAPLPENMAPEQRTYMEKARRDFFEQIQGKK